MPILGGTMSLARNPGRVAGLWYLLLTLLGPIRLMYVPSKLFVPGDAASTVANLGAHEGLFRTSIASELLCSIVLIFLVLAFYRLFEGVDRNLAVQVIVFGGVMPGVIDFFNATADLAAITVAQGVSFLSAFSKAQQDALVMLFLRLGDHSNTAAELLWGVWLIPLGLLVYKSRFVPRLIGVWLLLNGAAYIAVCGAGIFTPPYQGKIFNRSFPILLGEIALMLWLVIRGAKPPMPVAASA
jgi:Domain of unknown function (DUF4386)